MPICRDCLEDKPDGSFHKHPRKANGLNSYCKDCQSKRNKLWRDKNKESRVLYKKNYYQLNKDKGRRHNAERYARKCQSTPSWLSKVHKQQIDEIYWLAKDLQSVSGEEYHVDHIVPLKGKNVCGLHVPWNLQILPRDVNQSKGNRYAD